MSKTCLAFHARAECARVAEIHGKGVSGSMRNVQLSVWGKGLLVAALVSCASMVSAAEPETKKESLAAASSAASLPPGAVARVNGTTIDAVELRRARKVLSRGQAVPAEQQEALDKQAVEQLIAAELLYQSAAKQEIKDLDKQVDAKLAQGKARFTDEQEFKNAIKELEMDEKDLREYTRRDLLISTFIANTFVSKVSVPETEIRGFYDKNPEQFTREESVKASHILIGTDSETSADDRKKAREKAEKLRKELDGGADFAAVAKENSTCPSGQQGGDLGFFSKGQMVPAFEAVAFAIKPGVVSDVVETQFGYHIIKVTEKKAAETVDFKDVRGKIEEFLKGQKVNGAVQAYLVDARKSAKIEILQK